jgi:hypothetical protein
MINTVMTSHAKECLTVRWHLKFSPAKHTLQGGLAYFPLSNALDPERFKIRSPSASAPRPVNLMSWDNSNFLSPARNPRRIENPNLPSLVEHPFARDRATSDTQSRRSADSSPAMGQSVAVEVEQKASGSIREFSAVRARVDVIMKYGILPAHTGGFTTPFYPPL